MKMTKDNEALAQTIESLMRQYYENYYRDDLSLVDWQERIENRLHEESNLAEPHIRKIEDWMGLDFAGKRVLVVGAGTGAECVAFAARGAEVHGIEPYDKAMEILHLKADLHGLPRERFQQAVAEQIPHPNESFDFVYCYTVLEHVADVERTVSEMIRVGKTGGLVYIQTPEYRFPYEGHYKIRRMAFSPRWVTSLQLWIQRRSSRFLNTVNFVTAPQLNRIFFGHNVLVIRVEPAWLQELTRANKQASPEYKFVERYGFGKDQFIFLRKLGPGA